MSEFKVVEFGFIHSLATDPHTTASAAEGRVMRWKLNVQIAARLCATMKSLDQRF